MGALRPGQRQDREAGKVTAHDVVYGVKRTINPETASDYAYVDYIIKNAEAINTGESTDLDSLGVRAVDDYTVEFTLEQPAGYFPGIAGMWVNRPQPKAAIEAVWRKVDRARQHLDQRPLHARRAGSTRARWSWSRTRTTMTPRTFRSTKINWAMVVEDSTAFAMYENGELDVQRRAAGRHGPRQG